MTSAFRPAPAVAVLALLACPSLAAEKSVGSPSVRLLRVPDAGIQPQVAVDGKGAVHLAYFKGPAAAGDLYYTRSDDGRTFSRPLRVNTVSGSAIAIGNVRGAHLALGKNGRPHVAWMGSDSARPRAQRDASPMLYTRLDEKGLAFERERNVIRDAVGLDGGGSLAADDAGNVYVVWHAPAPGEKGEQLRGVWVARSTDEGKTFAPETPVFDGPTGACGCCGMRAFADHRGRVYVLYRAAIKGVHRDMYLLTSAEKGAPFRGVDLQGWEINACPMSTAAFAEGPDSVLAAWETKGQVYFATVDPATGKPSAPRAAPGDARGRKHPSVAGNARGEVLLAWTEGMGWEKGGALAWQIYDKDGKPTAARGRADGVPTWSLVAAFARPDGGFTIVY